MDALEGTDGERLRLPLLLPDDNILVDISTQGDEISIPPLSFTAQLTQQAQKLPWTKILSKPLGTIDDDTAEERPEIPPVLIAKETIHKARAEIGITLEVIDQLLLAEKKANKDAAISYLRVLTAPEKPPPGDRRHTEDLQLNIASKLQHLSDIAAYLADVAERLQISTTRDQAFYGELTAQLREKDWIIQSKTLDGFRQTMYLDYTYQNAGSLYQEVGHADIKRSITTEKDEDENGSQGDGTAQDVNLLLYHRNVRRLRMQLENPRDPTPRNDLDSWKEWEHAHVPTEKGLYKELALARSSIFDTEVFRSISKDLAPSRPGASSARLLQDAVAVSLERTSEKLVIRLSDAPTAACEVDQSPDEMALSSPTTPEFSETSLVELVAQQAVRQNHQNNLRNARSQDRQSGFSTGSEANGNVFSLVSGILERRRLRASIQAVVDRTCSCLGDGFGIICRRTRGFRAEESPVDTSWSVEVNQRWTLTVDLKLSGQITCRTTVPNVGETVLLCEEVQEYIWNEILRMSLHIVKEELDRSIRSPQGQDVWMLDGLTLQALIPTLGPPLRVFVDVGGAGDSSFIRIFVSSPWEIHEVHLKPPPDALERGFRDRVRRIAWNVRSPP